MTYAEVTDALLPRIGSMSVLKICLAVASQTEGAREQVRLAVTDFIELTGMSKQSVLNGLEAALAQGWISRDPAGNSFWYRFETKKLNENGTKIRPKWSKSQTKTVQDLDPHASKNQTIPSQDLDQNEKPIHLSELKEEERRAPSAPPPPDAHHLSSEERFAEQMRTGKDPELSRRSNAEHLQKRLNPATFRDRQVQESFQHWYDVYPRELIEAVVKAVPRVAGSLGKPARFVLVDILNDAAWHLDAELLRVATELLRPVPKLDEVYEARVPTGPNTTILREVKIMRCDRRGVQVRVKQPSREQDKRWDYTDAYLPLSSLVEFKRMARSAVA